MTGAGAAATVRLTHIGGPTLLIEVGGWRLLTDPTFDPPGRHYRFGWGTGSTKLTGPAVPVADMAPVHAILLTHDQHADNLDTAGRQLLTMADTVITTPSAARRLGGSTVGLASWTSTTLSARGRPDIEVTATPCRHGPPLSRRITGDVIGFALSWPDQRHGTFWITGDTVWHRPLHQVADRLPIGTVVTHLGAVGFPLTGPLRYSLTARQAIKLLRAVNPRTIIPVHYEGWSHFQQDRPTVEEALAQAPDIARRISWLRLGSPSDLPA